MRIGKALLAVLTLLVPATVLAQGPPPAASPDAQTQAAKQVVVAQGPPPEEIGAGPLGPGGGMGSVVQMRDRGMGQQIVVRSTNMGEWWQNSALVKKLKLTDQQVKQLSSVFYQHRLKLIDFEAAVEKQDLELQNLLDQDEPNEGQVKSQVDRTLAARANLEREFTMMNLDLRKVLTVEQWKELKATNRTVQAGMGGGNQVFFYRRFRGNGCGQVTAPAPPFPPPPVIRGGQRLDPQ